MTEKFPSPLGVYVFNQKLILDNIDKQRRFPSPLGDYVFNQEGKDTMKFNFKVSVPSRGLCFQSQVDDLHR